ncbi:10617_t:CDS:2, partial [Funneliformis mosseae]
VKQNGMLQEISTPQEIKNTLIINIYQESYNDINDKNVNIDSQASIPSNNFISSDKYGNDHQQSSLIEEKFDENNHQITILIQTEEPLVEKHFDRDYHQITIPIQIGESLVEKIFDDHQVTIQTEEPLMEELLDTDSEETEDLFELKIGLTFTNWLEFKI